MTTKKELEEQLEASRKLTQKYRDENSALELKITNFERAKTHNDFELAEMKKHNWELGMLKETIAKIIAGKSSAKSKVEVIEDLMSNEVEFERNRGLNREHKVNFNTYY